MDAPQVPLSVDVPSKQEVVDRFARLRTVWLDLASSSLERDELAAVAEELKLLPVRPAVAAACQHRSAAAIAQHEALSKTVSTLLAEAAGKFEVVGRTATENRLAAAERLISPLIATEVARIRSALPQLSSLNVISIEKPVASPAAAPVDFESLPAGQESSEDDYNASIDTLQAMFSVPRRVAARALARARLRLPAAIEMLLDKPTRDVLIEQSGLVVPPVTLARIMSPQRIAAATPEPPPLISFDPEQPYVPAVPVAAIEPSVFEMPNLSPRSEALRIEEAARVTKELEEKAEQYYKQLSEEKANEELARKLANDDLAARTYPCNICGDSLKLEEMYVLDDCSHRYCRECLKGYLISKINDGKTRDIRCPEPKCKHLVSYVEVRHLVDPPTFEKFEKFLLQATLNDDPNTKWCPRPGCGNAVISIAKGGSAHSTFTFTITRPDMLKCNAPSCGFTFCMQCLEPWHADSTCEQYKQWKLENSESEKRFTTWAEANTKECPKCKAKIEKDGTVDLKQVEFLLRSGGCNHMTCGKCEHEFCWLCMGDYSDDHYSDGGCEQYT